MKARSRHTIQQQTIFDGVGVHTGQPVRVVCDPAKAGEGCVFERADLPGRPSWKLSGDVRSGEGRRTRVGDTKAGIDTIEHFLAALWTLGISDLRVSVSGPEMPVMDGSALPFVEAFEKAGLREQGLRELRVLQEPVFVSRGNAVLAALPHDGFRVSYTLDYGKGDLAAQTASWDLAPGVFRKEIASARTFCSESEAKVLREKGYGLGATYENTLVIGDRGPVQNTYRFANEPLRHKVLDMIGDLSVLECDLKAHIVGLRSGHDLNHELAAKIAASGKVRA